MADEMANDSTPPAHNTTTEEPKEVDALIFQVVMDEQQSISHGLEEMEFNAKEKNGQNSSSDSPFQGEINALNGQRQPREIKIERYLSQGSMASSLTSDDVPLKELPDKIHYFSGIPAVEVIKGIIHLYRDRSKPINERSSAVVCILGIPVHLSLSDLLKFLGPVQHTVKSLQVVRDTSPNQYMTILKFKTKDDAESFYLSYNMKRYSSFEKRVCQLVYASRIEVLKHNEYKQRSLPGPKVTEVPSCSICLERLDETVLKILCNHSFHMDCLIQWEDATCPVCRYTQIPEISSENSCSMCDSQEDLWICLICGHVGCGRYLGGHAYEHFHSTQHTFSLQVGSQRVWDYTGDNYVHRLVQNKTDGKLVEIQGTSNNNVIDDEKVDSLQLEYTYLLTSQLDSQRIYFEEKLERAEKDATEQIELLKIRLKMLAEENEKLASSIQDIDKEKKEKDRKISQMQNKMTKLNSELEEEKELNKCLSDNQKSWRDKVNGLEEKMSLAMKQKDLEILELKDQVKDLMFYMETQQKISAAPDEMKKDIQDGQVIISKSQESSGGKKSRKKGRHS